MAKYTPCLNNECFFTQTPKEYCVVHHIFYGNPGRKLSEKWGMKVYLVPRMHTQNEKAVHENIENDLILKRFGQEKFEELHGHEKFMEVFKTNYL